MALKSDITQSPIVEEIKVLICKAKDTNLNIELCWVPGHVNVEGNEKADRAAKEASSRPPEATYRAVPHTDMRRPLRPVHLGRPSCQDRTVNE